MIFYCSCPLDSGILVVSSDMPTYSVWSGISTSLVAHAQEDQYLPPAAISSQAPQSVSLHELPVRVSLFLLRPDDRGGAPGQLDWKRIDYHT